MAGEFAPAGPRTARRRSRSILNRSCILLPWDDEEIDRQSGLALFDAFASKEKTLHANPGGHHQVPWFEVDNSARFFAPHLGRVGTSPA
jgi:hypothetical protein